MLLRVIIVKKFSLPITILDDEKGFFKFVSNIFSINTKVEKEIIKTITITTIVLILDDNK